MFAKQSLSTKTFYGERGEPVPDDHVELVEVAA